MIEAHQTARSVGRRLRAATDKPLWMKANDRFNSGEPGLGLEVARWLIERQVSLTGSDTWATEVVPNPDKRLAFPVHAELITKNGIFNHENLNFDELIKDRFFIGSPEEVAEQKIRGSDRWRRYCSNPQCANHRGIGDDALEVHVIGIDADAYDDWPATQEGGVGAGDGIDHH